MALRRCSVGFKDVRGITHSVHVEAESLYEAAVLGIKRLSEDPWTERIGATTQLEIDVPDTGSRHVVSMRQIERWLAGAAASPVEATKKAKLKLMLVQR